MWASGSGCGQHHLLVLNGPNARTFFQLLDGAAAHLDDEFVAHCTDMRRMRDWNLRQQVMEFRWVKSEDANDHFWYSTSYAYLAKFMLGTVTGEGGGTLPLVSSFRVKPAVRNAA